MSLTDHNFRENLLSVFYEHMLDRSRLIKDSRTESEFGERDHLRPTFAHESRWKTVYSSFLFLTLAFIKSEQANKSENGVCSQNFI